MEKQELKDNQDTIYKTLIKASRGNKNGIDCAYRRKDLFLKINLCKKKTLGDRLFRRIFADMVLAGYNVGSCSGIGYFLVKSLKDKQIAVKDTLSRAKTLFKKAKQMENNYSSKLSKKLFNVKNSKRKI